jgi:integrase
MAKVSEEMKRATGVTKRPGSNIWQWGIKAPADLRSHYRSQWAHRCSLETADLRAANEKAAQLTAIWQELFAEQRRALNPTAVPQVTPEMALALAQRVYTATLQQDDSVRGNPLAAQTLLRVVRALPPSPLLLPGRHTEPPHLTAPVDLLDGLPKPVAAELSAIHKAMEVESAVALATQQLKAVLPIAQAEAAKLGIHFDTRTPGALDALRECLKAQRRARSAVVQRDEGAIVETPAPIARPIETRASTPLTLRAVFGKWKTFELRGPDAVSACERALKLYEEWAGPQPPAIQHITRAQGAEFKAWLLQKVEAGDMSSKTAHDRMVSVCGLLRHAAEELEVVERHAWRGLSIKYKTENPRRMWSHGDLQNLAALPLFQSYALPQRNWRAGGAAAYWVPLLGLYTGATVSELCQLQTGDVEMEADGGALLHITDAGTSQQLKGEARRRIVPVHSELIRLGFLEYVQATAQAAPGSLWPQLKFRTGKPGANLSAWFSELRQAKPETGSPLFPDFHSMRHTVRSKMTSAGFDVSIQDRVTGHTVKGSAGTRVYTHVEVPLLRKAVESIHYPGMELPRVYARPVPSPSRS